MRILWPFSHGCVRLRDRSVPHITVPPPLCSPDPNVWSEYQVLQWLSWAIKEFNLEGVNQDSFLMSGRMLCEMSKEAFLSLAPPFVGDILWEHLDVLQKGEVETDF